MLFSELSLSERDDYVVKAATNICLSAGYMIDPIEADNHIRGEYVCYNPDLILFDHVFDIVAFLASAKFSMWQLIPEIEKSFSSNGNSSVIISELAEIANKIHKEDSIYYPDINQNKKLKLFYFMGEEFSSIKKVFDRYNNNKFTYAGFYERIRRGMSLKEAIFGERKKDKSRKYKFSGGKFTAAEIANKLNISVTAVLYRIRTGWNEQEMQMGRYTWRSTGKARDEGKAFRYELNGKKYEFLHQIATEHGLTESQLHNRLSNGTLEQAVAMVPLMGRITESYAERMRGSVTRDGVLYFATIMLNGEIYHKIGVTSRDVRTRLSEYSYSLIHEISGNLLDLSLLERKVLEKFDVFRAEFVRGPSGSTELFKLNRMQQKWVMSFLADHAPK